MVTLKSGLVFHCWVKACMFLAKSLHLSQQRAAQKTLLCRHPPGTGVPTMVQGWALVVG